MFAFFAASKSTLLKPADLRAINFTPACANFAMIDTFTLSLTKMQMASNPSANLAEDSLSETS